MPRVDAETAYSTKRLHSPKSWTQAFAKVLCILKMRYERSGRVSLAIARDFVTKLSWCTSLAVAFCVKNRVSRHKWLENVAARVCWEAGGRVRTNMATPRNRCWRTATVVWVSAGSGHHHGLPSLARWCRSEGHCNHRREVLDACQAKERKDLPRVNWRAWPC